MRLITRSLPVLLACALAACGENDSSARSPSPDGAASGFPVTPPGAYRYLSDSTKPPA
jgi:hypothetical protein